MKVPVGDSVPDAYRSHTLVLSGEIMLGLSAITLHTPFTLRYVVLSVALDSLRLSETAPVVVVTVSSTNCNCLLTSTDTL